MARESDGAAAGAAPERLWTPANIVTFLRICGIPVFVIVLLSPWPAWLPVWESAAVTKRLIATGIFVLLAATDSLDGYLARSRGEVTNFGKFMDPIADKMLVAAALLALIELDVLPSWVALVILCREFIVSGLRMVAASQGVVIAASWYGKAKTVTQIIAIVLFLIKEGDNPVTLEQVWGDWLYLLAWAVMAVALVLTIVSMLDYLVKSREILGFVKRDADSKRCEAPAGGFGEGRRRTPLTADDASAPSDGELVACAKDVLAHAQEAQMSIGTAESCTGGLIAGTLTAVPGSSENVAGGIVSYSNEVKHAVLGVPDDVLAEKGAVSEEAACAMAAGARERLGCDVAVSVTGIAGPGGAVPGKPVGTVWIGVASARGTRAALHVFPGGRDEVRARTVRCALEELACEIARTGTQAAE